MNHLSRLKYCRFSIGKRQCFVFVTNKYESVEMINTIYLSRLIKIVGTDLRELQFYMLDLKQIHFVYLNKIYLNLEI